MSNTGGYKENPFLPPGDKKVRKKVMRIEENKKITLEITSEDYKQIEKKSIYNNCKIDDYIINKILDRKLRTDDEERRTEILKTRITPTELKYIQEKIKGTNYTMSEFIRASILEKEILVVDGVEELAKQLRAVGGNLNQLTILAHKGLIKTPNIDKVEKKLDEIWNIMNNLITKKKR